jgi:hypothetical protein
MLYQDAYFHKTDKRDKTEKTEGKKSRDTVPLKRCNDPTNNFEP